MPVGRWRCRRRRHRCPSGAAGRPSTDTPADDRHRRCTRTTQSGWSTSARSKSMCAATGAISDRPVPGVDDGAPDRERVGGRARRRGQDQPVADVRGERAAIELHLEPHGVAHLGLLDRPPRSAPGAARPRPLRWTLDLEAHALLDPVGTGEEALERHPDPRRLDLGQVAELARGSPRGPGRVVGHARSTARNIVPSPPRLSSRSSPTASSSSARPAPAARAAVRCGEQADLVAAVGQPVDGLDRELRRSLAVQDEAEDAHRATSPRSGSRPGIGEDSREPSDPTLVVVRRRWTRCRRGSGRRGRAPGTPHFPLPRAAGTPSSRPRGRPRRGPAPRTRDHRSELQSAGSVITPRPRLTTSPVASNWGFTSTTIQPLGSQQPDQHVHHGLREMNDRSATTPSNGPSSSGSTWRRFVRSIATDPSIAIGAARAAAHDRRRAPRPPPLPLQQRIGEPAGGGAGIQHAGPAGSSPNASSAADQLLAAPSHESRGLGHQRPRPRSGRPGGRRCVAGAPPTSTRPSSMSGRACTGDRPVLSGRARRRGGGAPDQPTERPRRQSPARPPSSTRASRSAATLQAARSTGHGRRPG